MSLTRDDAEYMAAFEHADLTGECEANPSGAAERLHLFATQLLATMDALEAERKVSAWLASQLVTARVRWPHLVPAHGLPNRAEEVWLAAAREATEGEK